MVHRPTLSRFGQLMNALQPSSAERQASVLESVGESIEALRLELLRARDDLNTLTTRVAEARRCADEVIAMERELTDTRAHIAGLPHATLLSDSVFLDGTAAERLRVRRTLVGERVEQPFARWMGVTRCVTTTPDVRTLWDRLLAFETASDGVLRGFPSAVLDMPKATVSIRDGRTLHVSLRQQWETSTPPSHEEQPIRHGSLVAIPRCAYDYPARKIGNFGHWLLDCVPQVVALSMVAPAATILLPPALKGFHRSTLALVGVGDGQLIPWEGGAVQCDRAVVLESDGRAGGGRPIAMLAHMRRRLAPTGTRRSSGLRTRRIYVSRSDASAKRRWISNEPDVEAVFQRRGFEVLRMAECPLDEQVRVFGEASIVAGSSGAGLADIIFASPGTHVIVLLSDSLLRWYAHEGGSRSLWATGQRAAGKELAALGDSPRFYAHLAASFEQVCHSFVGGDDMPLDQLSVFLDDVLRQVDRA